MYHLLLVEDEAIIALHEQKTLERNGFAVKTAYNGEGAVETVAVEQDIDLVLMDIDLGSGIDGIEATRQILELRDIPVVFLTAHAEKEYIDRVEEITSYGYVLKSSGELVLIQAVRMALKLFDAYTEAREHSRMLRLVTENVTELIVTIDQDMNVTFVTPSVERLLGYSPEEAMELQIGDILTEESRARALEARRTHAEGDDTPITLELEHVRKDGSTVWLETTARPFVDERGRRLGLIGTSRDITDRKRREEELQDLYENAPIAYFSVGREFRIHRCNRRAAELLGYSCDEMVGRPVFDFYANTPEGKDKAREVFLRFLANEPVRGEELEMRRADGSALRVGLSVSPVVDSEGVVVESRSVVVQLG